MSVSGTRFRIDASDAIRVAGVLSATPKQLDRARIVAYARTATWVQRRILQGLSQSLGMPQARLKKAARIYWSKLGPGGRDGVKFWVGTNPVKAHRLGTVTWNRRMIGARVGRRSFPGTWSWGPRGRTGPAVMQRTGRFGRRGSPRLERIDTVKIPIHESAKAALQAMLPEAGARFAELLKQQIAYYTRVRSA